MIEEKVLDCPHCRSLGTVIPLPPELWNTVGEVGKTTAAYLPTGWLTFDSALGGGFALRAFTTFCGNPGIGKSTLSLQISQAVAQQGKSVLYFSTEEDIDRVKARAKRLKATHPKVTIKAGKNWREFVSSIPYQKSDMIILDSLSRIFDEEDKAAVGSIAQIRRCGLQLTALAKMSNWVVMTIVHTTKSGEMAGHKGLGFDSDVNLRLLMDNKTRAISLIPDKNRFGSTDEIVFFKMEAGGMFIVQPETTPHKNESLGGVAYTVILYEGRPLVIEVQSSTRLGMGGKTGTKMIEIFNSRRVGALIKLLGYFGFTNLPKYDIFLRAYSPTTVNDENADLSVVASLMSSFEKFNLPNDTIFIGKVDYDGNVMPCRDIDDRLEAADRMKFKKCISGVRNKDITFKKIDNTRIENILEIVAMFGSPPEIESVSPAVVSVATTVEAPAITTALVISTAETLPTAVKTTDIEVPEMGQGGSNVGQLEHGGNESGKGKTE